MGRIKGLHSNGSINLKSIRRRNDFLSLLGYLQDYLPLEMDEDCFYYNGWKYPIPRTFKGPDPCNILRTSGVMRDYNNKRRSHQ